MKFAAGSTPKNFIDISEMRFGMIKVLSRDGTQKGKAMWLCKCDCGKEFICSGSALRLGQYSCGCTKNAKKTHGMSYSRTYRIWSGMIQRCTNKKHHAFYNYGGRGIKVCAQWYVFENFLSSMGESPDGYSIERIDNNGDYDPQNCKWIPLRNQGKNKRCSLKIDGASLADVAELNGIKYSTMRYRAKNGKPLDAPVGRSIFLTLNEKTMNIKQWADILNIRPSTIVGRRKRGLPIEDVLKEKHAKQ